VVPDSVEGGGLDEPRWKSVEIPCSREVHAKWERALWLARRVNGVDGGAAYAAEAIAAEVLSAIPFEGKGAEEPEAEDGGLPAGAEPDVDPLPPDPALSTFTDGLEDADAFELDARLRTLLAHEQKLDAEVGPLLAALWRTSAPRQLGYGRLDVYARERLGMDPTRARALVRIEDVARTCPELATAYRAGKLSLVQAQVVVPVLIADVEGRFDARWVAWAQAVTVRRLRDDVARARALLQTDPEAWRATGGLPPDASGEDREIRAIPIAPETPEDPTERCSVRLWAPYDIQHFFRAVHASARLYLERRTGRFPTAGEALGAMCDHVFEAWGAPFEHKGSVFARDGWRCAAPGCTSTGNLHEHHIVFRSRGGSNARDNRITLCAFHHLRFARPTLRVPARAVRLGRSTRSRRYSYARRVSREFELPQRLITPEDAFLRRRDFLVGNAELSVELAPAAESRAATYDNSCEFGSAALYHS
jgi:5-methylcytosine-specific restriction endonuclease McrA